MVRRIKGLNTELALQYVMSALRPGPFKDSICRKRPRVEEMKQAYKKDNQEAREKSEGKTPEGQTARPGGFRPREPPRGSRFQQYTPLNAPLAHILQEALSVNLIPSLKKRPMPPGADNSKH